MLALHIDEALAEGDLSLSGGTLVEGADLRTMAILSIFCDAPARDGDPVDAQSPRPNNWADAYDQNGDISGSRLWILKRAKVTLANRELARQYVDECLAWMVTDGLADRVEAFSEIRSIAPGVRAIFFGANIYKPGEPTPIAAGPWRLVQGAA